MINKTKRQFLTKPTKYNADDVNLPFMAFGTPPAQAYEATIIELPSDFESNPLSIFLSETGLVVGSVQQARDKKYNPLYSATQAFLWDKGKVTFLGDGKDILCGQVLGVSDDGSILGHSIMVKSENKQYDHHFYYSKGKFTFMDPASKIKPYAISRNGAVLLFDGEKELFNWGVGDKLTPLPDLKRDMFEYKDSRLNMILGNNQVIGVRTKTVAKGMYRAGYIYSNGAFNDFPHLEEQWTFSPQVVNGKGQVVGKINGTTNMLFLYDNNRLFAITPKPKLGTGVLGNLEAFTPTHFSDTGLVLGTYALTGPQQAHLLVQGRPVPLASLVTNMRLKNMAPRGINSKGQILVLAPVGPRDEKVPNGELRFAALLLNPK
jgi:uncharacterized membrane protein